MKINVIRLRSQLHDQNKEMIKENDSFIDELNNELMNDDLLLVENDKDAAICPFCNSAYIVEKAINNYNIGNINANVVNIYGCNIPNDFVIRAGILEGYNGASSDITVPDNVIRISQKAFSGLPGIRSVILPKSITEIPDAAFEECADLEEVIICSGVKTIGSRAFSGCSKLKGIILPDSIENIGDRCFADCVLLASVKLPAGLKSIGNYMFVRCSSLKEICIPDTVLTIGNSAFSNCTNLQSVTIPKGLKSIDSYAFENCYALRKNSLNIPNTCYKIGKNALPSF